MKNQSSTYGRTRTDWTSEVKPARNGMDTGHETPRAVPDIDGNGMDTRTMSGTSRPPSNSGAAWDMDTRAASDAGHNNAAWDTGRGGMASNGATWDTGRNRAASDTGRGGIDAGEWPPDAETLVLPDDRSPVPMGPRTVGSQDMGEIWPNIENNLSNEVIESPTTMEEVYRGSMKSLLLRNVGNYVVATFLIGTQTTVSWEGILYDVGNDYLAIYQSGRDQYIVSDLYSLKYVEFYDTRRRELCDSLLTAQEPGGNFQRQ
ncbi:MAG: hypothetical protein IJQ25_00780 [Oscillibacter sp.]|nr:hypothetical protein [Oscillibacter sp.]MBQ7682192.1 hypothetical protein [Oscillibacter sp.]